MRWSVGPSPGLMIGFEVWYVACDELEHSGEVLEMALFAARVVLDPESPFRLGSGDLARLQPGAQDEHVEMGPAERHKPPSVSPPGIAMWMVLRRTR